MHHSYTIHSEKFGERNTTIERVNVFGGYSKENCRWATRKEQQRNKRNTVYFVHEDKNKTLAELSENSQIKYTTLYYRIVLRKWNVEKALTTPVKR
jgi:hypothetical protein